LLSFHHSAKKQSPTTATPAAAKRPTFFAVLMLSYSSLARFFAFSHSFFLS